MLCIVLCALPWSDNCIVNSFDKREKKEYTDYDIPVDVFRENTCAGFEYKQVAQRLKSEGILIHSPGGLTLQRRPHGGSPLYDVYCVRLRVGDFGDIGDLG